MAQAERWLEEIYYRDIALVRALELRVRTCTPEEVALEAPLAPNANDKGTAFAGSLASLMTLAGWGLVRYRLQQAGRACDIVIHRSMLHYRSPVTTGFVARARWDAGANTRLRDYLTRRGRSRILLPVWIEAGGETRASMDARYVALRREEK